MQENGIQSLINEGIGLYKKPMLMPNMQTNVENLWDDFERLKTYYYPNLGKKESATKIVNDISLKLRFNGFINSFSV